MTHDRYFQILANLHINDNLSIPPSNTDKLYKLHPFIDRLNKNFMKVRDPTQKQSIDENMVLFKGRFSIKQYNLMKPIKRGYKLWCKSDIGEQILELIKSLVGKNHIIMDNYFSSSKLFEELKAHGIHACGTV